ncbi:NAD-dependent histone deacetylase SIR2 [Ceratobasidium sp. AG-Ba]|nr:NAD-dependent histone deacetylase SIR2 [Ceratobasidium sp. AG-Ba]
MPPSESLSDFLEVLRGAKNVVILAGAGLSAGSGIRTYRGVGGLWTNNDPGRLASPEGFREDPGLIWKFYDKRIEQCRQATPNAAHRTLASLALPSVQSQFLPSLDPKWTPPLLVTQNFDGLSVRALQDLADQLSADEMSAAQSRLIETHGSAFRVICTQCKCAKSSAERLSCPAFDDGAEYNGKIPVEDLPRCGGREWNGSNRYGRCGGLLRPGVVWFGEVPEQQGRL